MSAKAYLITFVSTALLIGFVGVISFFVWSNQPTADESSPPVPPAPEIAKGDFPPVPSEPRIKGDVTDDGIVELLDLNGLIARWKQTYADYNLVDESDLSDKNVLNTLDLAQVIKYWQCLELKSNCEYKD